MSAAYINQYLVNQVNTATPEELLILLYNGAIRFLSEAETAMEDGRVARRGELISKTILIISELDSTLNHDIGGKIASDLDALYVYMNRELLEANMKDDSRRLTRVKNLLVGLRDTWMEAIKKVQAGQMVANGKRQTAEGSGLESRAGAL